MDEEKPGLALDLDLDCERPGGAAHAPNWREPQLHTAITAITGDPVTAVSRVSGGHRSSLKFRIEVADGTPYFLKATHLTRMRKATQLLQRELAIISQLPPEVPAPRVAGVVRHRPWLIAIFAFVPHTSSAEPSWNAEMAPPLVAYISDVYRITGSRHIRARSIQNEPRRFTGFAQLNARKAELETAPTRPELLWLRSHIAELPNLEQQALALIGGDTLIHCDLSPGNILGTPGGPKLVDWAHAHLGNPVLDIVAMLMRVEAENLDRTSLVAASKYGIHLNRRDMAWLVSAVCGMFISRALLAQERDQRLRAERLRYGLAGLRWLQDLL